jgi:hypothetical protein
MYLKIKTNISINIHTMKSIPSIELTIFSRVKRAANTIVVIIKIPRKTASILIFVFELDDSDRLLL